MSYMNALLTPATLVENVTPAPCTWCSDGQKAAHAIVENGYTDYACVRHTEKYWPGLRPADRRPVRDATVFKLRMFVTVGKAVTDGGWESYTSFAALFAATRSLSKGRAFFEQHSGSNSHYRKTGHHRIVWCPHEQPTRSPRAHVVMHIVVK